MVIKVLIDTNILIDLMNGVPEAKAELGYFSDFAISSITWMEVMVGCKAQVDTLKLLGRTIITRNPADFDQNRLRVPYRLACQKDRKGNIIGGTVSDVAEAPTT